jgi:uncharacterized membrane protein
MRVLILIQLLAGFVLAFLGVIIMFHMYEVWLGLGITLVGFYAVIRAVHHSSYENGMERGRELYDDNYGDEDNRDGISQSEMDEIITKANKKES